MPAVLSTASRAALGHPKPRGAPPRNCHWDSRPHAVVGAWQDKDTHVIVKWCRRQFPVRLAFAAMTINKVGMEIERI